MSRYQEIACPTCDSHQVMKAGYSAKGEPRYRCVNPECTTKSFILNYCYATYQPVIKKQLVDMALNGTGIRDTARVLGIAKGTVIQTLKNSAGYRPT